MRFAWLLALMVLGCGGADESIEGDVAPVREAVSALTKAKVAAMNRAAKGTGISYTRVVPPDPYLPETLALQFVPNGDLRRTSRYHVGDNGQVADVLVPPDPCNGAECAPPAIHLGHAATAWWPPDPCLPPDPCKTSFDIAGANLRIVGNGGDNADGTFITAFQVLDESGNVVFDSAMY